MKNTKRGFIDSSNLLIAGVFCLLILLNKFFFHEMWKDEWQAWQLGTKTDSVAELFTYLPGEGHPALWFLFLRGWNFLLEGIFENSAEWFRLQFLHLLLVFYAVFILIFQIKAERWKKILFLSGYFILYEYSVIARPYIILVILSLLFVVQLQKESQIGRDVLIKGLLIFLLTQIEVYGVFIATGFVLSDILKSGRIRYSRIVLVDIVILIIGAGLFYLQVNPADSAQIYESAEEQRSTFRLFADPFHSLTLNTFIPGFAETVFREDPGLLSLILGALIFTGIIALFKRELNLLISFVIVFLLFYVFGVIFFLGGVRNWGVLYVFVLCLLFLKNSKPENWKEYVIIGVMFLFQFIHGVNVMLSDVTGKFSNSQEAGLFMAVEIPQEVPVIGLNKAFCVPLTGYSERSLIGMPDKKPYYFFEERDWRGKTYLPDMKELLLMKEHLRSKKIVVVYNKPLNSQLYPLLKPMVKFDEPSLRKENYFFYYF